MEPKIFRFMHAELKLKNVRTKDFLSFKLEKRPGSRKNKNNACVVQYTKPTLIFTTQLKIQQKNETYVVRTYH